MRVARSLLALPCLLALSGGGDRQTLPPASSIAVTHVTVIDGTGHVPRPDMTVVISGDRIVALRPAREAKTDPGTTIVDGRGRFLIPGLWDMHVHSGDYESGKELLPLLVANGITGIRDMGSPLDDILRLRKESEEGKILAPRMVVAGPLLETTLPPAMASNPMLISAGTPEAARAVVDRLKARGVDFIKVHDSVPREAYFEIARESARLGIPFAGHVPPTVTSAEAARAGQRSIEHLGGNYRAVLLDCSSQRGELQKAAQALLADSIERVRKGQGPDEIGPFRADFVKPLVETFRPKGAKSLLTILRRHRTWQTPTLVALRASWDSFGSDLSPEERALGERLLDRAFELVRQMKTAGIGILAGTDTPPENSTSRLGEELAMMVRAGLSPMEALQTATREPAAFLQRLESLGTITEGKSADLVLLDGNPLEDVKNTRMVHAVILRGRLVSPEEIERIRSQAR